MILEYLTLLEGWKVFFTHIFYSFISELSAADLSEQDCWQNKLGTILASQKGEKIIFSKLSVPRISRLFYGYHNENLMKRPTFFIVNFQNNFLKGKVLKLIDDIILQNNFLFSCLENVERFIQYSSFSYQH